MLVSRSSWLRRNDAPTWSQLFLPLGPLAFRVFLIPFGLAGLERLELLRGDDLCNLLFGLGVDLLDLLPLLFRGQRRVGAHRTDLSFGIIFYAPSLVHHLGSNAGKTPAWSLPQRLHAPRYRL